MERIKRRLVIRRGPYIIASGLDSPLAEAPPVTLHGPFLSLFQPGLPELSDYSVHPGSRALLVDLNAAAKVGIVAAACRVRDEKVSSNSIKFNTDGIDESNGIICLKVPSPPRSITMDNAAIPADAYEFQNGLLRLRIANSPDVRHVSVVW